MPPITAEQVADAQATLFSEAYVPAFFEKLAEFGYTPKTEAEADKYLQLGAQLQELFVVEQKQAGVKNVSALDRYIGELNQHMKAAGLSPAEQADPVLTKAAEAALRPELARAVLTLSLAGKEAQAAAAAA